VGSTFANWVSTSVEIVEVVEHMDDIDEDIFEEDTLYQLSPKTIQTHTID
jgi:hypothetical protein